MAAAQNPCVPNWQWTWKVPPSLEITAPKNETDRCVGPTTVGPATVTATAGVKWQVDMNNCPLSPPGTNETAVPITPTNTWSLYLHPQGTTPTSGSGTTAVFTNIHGGSVVVQFETRATVASPPWDSGLLADRCNPFRVFEVISLLPDQGTEIDDGDGNPHTKMFVVCREPGNVTVTATPNPSVLSESELPLCWTLIGGTGTSRLTRTVNKATAGSTTLVCTAGTSQETLTLKVVEVASATVSEGTEIDDGDGNPNTKTFVLCKGTGNATVTATANPSMTEAQLANTCWTTTGGTGTAKLTRTVSKATAGSTTVNFTAGTSYKTVTVKVIEVASATVSEGTEIDDGDGNPNTKTFVLCKGTGNATVTAAANPIMTEAQLANTCWTTTGGTGTAKLTRTVSKATAGSTTVTFTAGTSYKSVTVKVVEVASATVSEGTEIDDGDGNPNTKTYVLCLGTGSVTVTATANPSMTEAQLANSCWTTTGGTGTAKLTRTVSKSTCGSTTVTFTAGTSSKSVTVHILNVDITEPNNSPVTDNNFTFDAVADPNGKCDVTATGTSCVASEDSKLEWTLTAIAGSTLTSSPNPPKGTGVTFTYTRLPSSNGEFGNKTLKLKHPTAGCEDTQIVQVFFSEEEFNNPGTTTPNWYYYWKQTSANYGTHSWEAGSGSGETRFDGGQWKAFLRNANESAAAGTWNNAEGIDFFANMCRHEERHRLDMIALWGANSDRVPANDTDGDYLPDSQEATLVTGHPYDNTKRGTYPDTFNYGENPLPDAEDYCLRREASWTNFSADSQDWANPGHQATK